MFGRISFLKHIWKCHIEMVIKFKLNLSGAIRPTSCVTLNACIYKEAHEKANAFSWWVKVVSFHKTNTWLCYIILNTYPHFHIWYTEQANKRLDSRVA